MSSARNFRLDPSIANLRGPALRQRYAQATPEERRALGFTRPATDEEMAAAPEHTSPGAPADFGGMVLPNPDNVSVSSDDESGVPVTRLPNGVTFNRQNFAGSLLNDVSNPQRAEILPPIIARPREQ